MNVFRHLKPFFKSYKYHYIAGIIVLLVVDLLQLITPRIMGWVTDRIISGTLTAQDILHAILGIMGIAIGVALLRYVWRIYILGTSRTLEYWLRNQLFRHLEFLESNFFTTHKTGHLMALATNDIQSIRMAAGMGIVMITDALFLTLTTTVMMITSISLKLTLIALIPLPFIALFVMLIGFRIQRQYKYVQEAFSDLSWKVQENFSGIRIIKSFVQEAFESQLFCDVNRKNKQVNLKLARLFGLMFPMVMLIASLSFTLALGFGSRLVISDVITEGDLVAFIAYLGLLTWPMMAVGWVINVIQRGIASIKRINEILDLPTEVRTFENAFLRASLTGNIRCENLTFSYPKATHPTLNNISFDIKAGQKVAFVGRTGSGKTTLMRLLLKQYQVSDHTLFFDDVDMNAIPISELRDNISYVAQDVFLFSRSIEKNIRLSNETISQKAAVEASKDASIHDEIMSFPDQYESELGERGINLSGGQKQRLALARTLVQSKPIVLLDDCLSAVDTKTEEHILSHLTNYAQRHTLILISHRISTVQDADRIYVLDQGNIVESGDHASLIRTGGIYADLYTRQQLEEKLESVR